MKIHRSFFKSFLAVFVLLTGTGLIAASVTAKDEVPAELVKKLTTTFSGIQPADVTPAPMKGWYQIKDGTAMGYVTEDGNYFIEGDLIDLKTDTNLSERQRESSRLETMAGVSKSQMIEFSSGKPKHWVTVFTDVDCGYCRMFHNQIADYNKEGIAIRYMFFPTAGPGSPAYKKAEAVWCADDPAAALTAAKAGQEVVPGNCKNPIALHYQIARQVGARGTPAIITDKGRLIGGYKPPAALLADLDR